MNKEQFLEAVKKYNNNELEDRKINISSLKDYHKARWKWDSLQEQRTILKYMNFQCDFKDGICRKARDKHSLMGPMCCCSECKVNIGYIKFIPKHLLNTYAKLFSTKTGFWRKNKGCILSHELRSKTCLTHNCSDDKKFRSGIFRFKDTLNRIENDIIELIEEFELDNESQM